MKKIILLFSCLSIITVFLSCKDNDTVSPIGSSNIDLIGQLNTPGYSSNVYVTTILSTNYAFLADGSSGLQIINVQNPFNPTIASAINTAESANDIFVATVNAVPYAFVSTGFGGLVIADVSNPLNPAPVDTIPMSGSDRLNTVFVDPTAQIAYLGTSSGNLLLYDVSGLPDGAVLRGTDDWPNPIYGLYVTAGFAYLAAGSDLGVIIENVSDPSNPTYVSYFPTSGSAWDVAVGGTYLYIADGHAGVTVLDISNQLDPQFYKNVATRGNPVTIYYSGSTAQFYIAEFTDGCELYSAGGSPPSINQLGYYSNNNNSLGVFFYNSLIYLADAQNGLLILQYKP
jgi:hypothetical protein